MSHLTYRTTTSPSPWSCLDRRLRSSCSSYWSESCVLRLQVPITWIPSCLPCKANVHRSGPDFSFRYPLQMHRDRKSGRGKKYEYTGKASLCHLVFSDPPFVMSVSNVCTYREA